jgi:hypothetical protein
MAEPKQGGDANAFIQQYSPIAERIGAQLNVDPRILLAQFGMETGWGKSIVPGTYNLGNIKSAGKGVEATDNVTKSKDRYLKFEDPDVFADYYADYMKRQFPGVIGAGSDVNAFNQALRPGQRGGYAEDKEYGSKLNSAFSLVTNRMESAAPSKEEPDDFGFGSGETEAQRIAKEPPPPPVEKQASTSKDDAALYGAGAGLAAGVIAGNTKQPVPPRLASAQERLQVARDRLNEVQSRVGSGTSLSDLEAEFKRAQGAYQAAEMELATATDEMKSARASRTAPVSAPEPDGLTPTADQQARGIQGTTKDTGITGRASQTTYNERTSQIARNQRQQQQTMQTLAKQGLIDPNKAYALTEGISASTPSGVLTSPTEAAIRQAQLEAELVPSQQRVDQARATRQATGETRRTANQALTQARRGQQSVDRAQGSVNVAQQALDRASEAKPGALSQLGGATAKVAPKVLGVISGAATGMAAMEAIEKFKQGDYSGAVLPTLEATFGVMSMLPPAHPILLALRGLGTAGGAALLGYEGYKAVKGEPKTAE